MDRPATGRELLFQFHGVPPIGISVSLALQHLVAMIVGCVTPPIMIASAIGLSLSDQVLLIQASLVMSAVCTLLQLYPIGGRFGSGLPVILGVSFAYVPSMQAIAASGGGVAAIAGAMIVGGIVATLGIVFPSLLIITVLAGVINSFSHLDWVQHAFAGIRVCVCVLIFNAVLKLLKSSVKDWPAAVIFVAVLAASLFTDLSPVIFVAAAALCGIVIQNLIRREK